MKVRPDEGLVSLTEDVSIHAPMKVRPAYLLAVTWLKVSIHAPMKVRLRLERKNYQWTGFNSRTHEGATLIILSLSGLGKFQFTHPWRCDDYGFSVSELIWFQFTHPWRCDLKPGQPNQHKPVSIHAPMKVRPSGSSRDSDSGVSIHAPMKVRLQISPSNLSGRGFQFTHPWRCDSGEAHRRSNFPVSIHAPMKVRRVCSIIRRRHISFNSRTHVGAYRI